MTLGEAILTKLKQGHRGRDRAIKRKDLLQYLYELGYFDKTTEVEDREMRAMIEQEPLICSCEDGYFIGNGKEDVDYSIEYIRKKAIPLLVKIRRKKEAYPQFYLGEQLELF